MYVNLKGIVPVVKLGSHILKDLISRMCNRKHLVFLSAIAPEDTFIFKKVI